MSITQDTYRRIIKRATYDNRLTPGDFVFLVRFVYLLDESEQDYLHLPYRQLLDRLNIGMGTITSGITHLIECHYIEGTLEAKPEGRQSWKLWLADMPEPQQVEPKKPLTMHEYEYGGLRFTVIVDKVVIET